MKSDLEQRLSVAEKSLRETTAELEHVKKELDLATAQVVLVISAIYC